VSALVGVVHSHTHTSECTRGCVSALVGVVMVAVLR